ncbi:hypothetical protein BEN49_05740 [Hymenobacter coccineus]|uniref:Uncharacterized protein n=1 Tax=Hymenobacter coccineus TaxID=1908235 RepID=A0A1G1TJD1_9BACT|nr:hypothetical protein BEN49_05740 [Hymenobacter coccineus]
MTSPAARLAHGQGPAQGLADQVFGHEFAHVPAHDFARVAVEPRSQIKLTAALFGQKGDVAHPELFGGGRGGLAQQ